MAAAAARLRPAQVQVVAVDRRTSPPPARKATPRSPMLKLRPNAVTATAFDTCISIFLRQPPISTTTPANVPHQVPPAAPVGGLTWPTRHRPGGGVDRGSQLLAVPTTTSAVHHHHLRLRHRTHRQHYPLHYHHQPPSPPAHPRCHRLRRLCYRRHLHFSTNSDAISTTPASADVASSPSAPPPALPPLASPPRPRCR